MERKQPRIGVDIGGTFTDVVLEADGDQVSIKVLTTYAAPENAIVDGIRQVCAKSGVAPGQISQIIHGTTLATNALIERRGAKTALITTKGFRDVIEMRTESRFEQYDLNLTLPPPLLAASIIGYVRRRARSDADGGVLIAAPRDGRGRAHGGDRIAKRAVTRASPIGLIHSLTSIRRARTVACATRWRGRLPDDHRCRSASEVSPQMREYERFNTVDRQRLCEADDEELPAAAWTGRLKDVGARIVRCF